MEIGRRIESEMERKNISQMDLAKRTGINRSVINRIVLGTRPARDEEIVLIAEALNVSGDYLLGMTPKADLDLSRLLEEKEVYFNGKGISEDNKRLISKLVNSIMEDD